MEISFWILLFLGANLLYYIECVCLQNTSSTCLTSFTELRKHVTSIQVTDLLIPSKNNTNHRVVCRLYEEYRSCKYTGFEKCYNEIQKEMTILDKVFDPICSKQFHDFVTGTNCIHRYRRHYKVCHRKKHNKDSHVPSYRSLHSKHRKDNIHCNITKDYIMCLYSVTALGCSIDVAENYFTILNQSLSTAFKYRGQLCILNHPLTAISTTSSSKLMMSHSVWTTPSMSVYSNLGSRNSAVTFSSRLCNVLYIFVYFYLILSCLDK
ncbi:hypothetical protein LOTGIDRAFT_152679 [Lottia gigantea]|uniref:Uncharacterized protein n=1 Tax=Lottia gigantea TaxID=225164 RepID=V4ARW0_LOTGI|nr:hypothetical protein LOTGIDRAFT_152679 [Lottia gigantea]ESO97590.1 hypothetical protein LOTGIDRAFT_152679 [Lottia gigantea]